MTIDQVIHVVAVRNGFVSAVKAMLMSGFMGATRMLGSTGIRICRSHFQSVALDPLVANMVHVAVVEIIDMIPMLHRYVTAIGAVLMVVVGMNGMAHTLLSFLWGF
jgi:hypothetical protein